MTDAVEEEIKLTQNSSKETVEVDDSNQEAIRRLSIENLEQEDMSENESELTNTPNDVVACTRNIGVQGDGTRQRRGQRSCNGSTDENPQHMYCPTESGSWCKYQKALAEGKEQDYVHPPAIAKAILDEIEDVFKKLSEPELLRKCSGGQIQNANESFNNVLWNIAPKTDFVALETFIEISAYIACIMFSTGWKELLFLMSNLDIEPGKNILSAAGIKDQLRIKEAKKQTKKNSKEARRLIRQLNIPTADNEYIWLGVFRGLISIETQSDN
ncbi:hypothetical protein TSAR_008977 [Trichomalopsis sarcophagae]|uniref:Uncharacterized protein n=1 Tax=Trichomalopsis sarcophagae TaxID=543379 RepID=A0A232FD25_9HYME|nr:hypothetical protein TSAR_008977 [Trichomalopsis sarcophagae]